MKKLLTFGMALTIALLPILALGQDTHSEQPAAHAQAQAPAPTGQESGAPAETFTAPGAAQPGAPPAAPAGQSGMSCKMMSGGMQHGAQPGAPAAKPMMGGMMMGGKMKMMGGGKMMQGKPDGKPMMEGMMKPGGMSMMKMMMGHMMQGGKFGNLERMVGHGMMKMMADGKMGMMGPGPMMGAEDDLMKLAHLSKLHLEPAQWDQVRKLAYEKAKQTQQLKSEKGMLKVEAAYLLGEEKLDQEKLKKIYGRFGEIEFELLAVSKAYIQGLEKILTPEQTKQLTDPDQADTSADKPAEPSAAHHG